MDKMRHTCNEIPTGFEIVWDEEMSNYCISIPDALIEDEQESRISEKLEIFIAVRYCPYCGKLLERGDN